MWITEVNTNLMDAHEVADQIKDTAEEEKSAKAVQNFRNRAAVAIAVLALLLAITSLAGNNVNGDIINKNILASDTWAFYQAKNIRQTSYRLAADELEILLPTLPQDQQKAATKKVDDYKATVSRYESEPDPKEPDNPLKGEGKKQLLARAHELEKQRDHALEQAPNFDYSSALYQISIVLGSVAILATSRRLLLFSLSLGLLAFLLMLNGFFLFLPLPF